jgi:hypothetical protein
MSRRPLPPEPTIAVPVSVYLNLLRALKEKPPPVTHEGIKLWLAAHNLEPRAYRKFLNWKKANRPEEGCSACQLTTRKPEQSS